MEAAERKGSPVPPPRTKKKAKPVKTTQPPATVSTPIQKPSVPKDKPAHPKLEKLPSAPQKAPPRRPQSPAVLPKSAPTTPKVIVRGSPLVMANGGKFRTSPRVKKKLRSTTSTDGPPQCLAKDDIHVLDTRGENIYRNVAPRKPGPPRLAQKWSNGLSKSVDLSTQRSVLDSLTQRSVRDIQQQRIVRKKSLEYSSQHSEPIGQKQPVTRKKSRPTRPAPPPPEKIAHYQTRKDFLFKTENVYSEIGPPTHNHTSSEEYSYVDFHLNRSLPTSRSLTEMSKCVEDDYVNHDYKGKSTDLRPAVFDNVRPVSVAVSSGSSGIYTSLTRETLEDGDDIYSLPLRKGLVRSNSFTHESEYSVVDNSGGELYMSLSPNTQDQASEYQQIRPTASNPEPS